MNEPATISQGDVSLTLSQLDDWTDPLSIAVSRIEGGNVLTTDEYTFSIEYAVTVNSGPQLSGVYSMTVDKFGADVTLPTIVVQEVHVFEGDLSSRIEIYFKDYRE